MVLKEKKGSFSSSKWSLENKELSSYNNVLNKLGEAILDSEHLFEFILKAFAVLYHTWLAILITFFFLLFHLIMIIYGKTFPLIFYFLF